MRMKRFITGTVAAGLLGLAPIALAAAPAQAATFNAQVKMEISYTKTQVGRSVSIQGNVVADPGSGELLQVPTGTATLQRKLAGSSSWSTLETDTSAGSFYFYPIKATQNATYRVVYSGGTYNTHVFNSATGERKLQVMRKLGDKIRRTTLSGKVSPTYKKKKVVIEIKKGGKWRKYTTLKTNSKGKWSKKLPAKSKCTYWRAYTPADTKFVKSYSNYSYYTVRGYKNCRR